MEFRVMRVAGPEGAASLSARMTLYSDGDDEGAW